MAVSSKNECFQATLKVIGISSNHNFSDFSEFSKNISLKILATINKKRSVYFLEEGIKLTFDKVNWLGKFIEIEKNIDDKIYDESLVKKQVLELMKRYIYDQAFNEVHIGYVELFLLKYNSKIYKIGKYKDLKYEKYLKLGDPL